MATTLHDALLTDVRTEILSFGRGGSGVQHHRLAPPGEEDD
jgi:hypothetical protein